VIDGHGDGDGDGDGGLSICRLVPTEALSPQTTLLVLIICQDFVDQHRFRS
jgi:hypothetical protein